MRDRLIELISQRIENKTWTVADLADHLLANGIIAPPCKPGDLLWGVYRKTNGEREVRPFSCEEIRYDILSGKTVGLLGHFPGITFEDISKGVLVPTKEEAEAKLKGEQ